MGRFVNLFPSRLTNAPVLKITFEIIEKFCYSQNVGALFSKEIILLKGRYFINSNSSLFFQFRFYLWM
jgi:hypothetical protein